ncbi:hypothetical protein LINPERHAP2_LOCUS7492 [Linum perenne]
MQRKRLFGITLSSPSSLGMMMMMRMLGGLFLWIWARSGESVEIIYG